MGVRTKDNSKSRGDSNSDAEHYLPKSLAELDKSFLLWHQTSSRVKVNLKQKAIYLLSVEGFYAKRARQKLKDFGKLYQSKVQTKG